jgi:hypothetical protein
VAHETLQSVCQQDSFDRLVHKLPHVANFLPLQFVRWAIRGSHEIFIDGPPTSQAASFSAGRAARHRPVTRSSTAGLSFSSGDAGRHLYLDGHRTSIAPPGEWCVQQSGLVCIGRSRDWRRYTDYTTWPRAPIIAFSITNNLNHTAAATSSELTMNKCRIICGMVRGHVIHLSRLYHDSSVAQQTTKYSFGVNCP